MVDIGTPTILWPTLGEWDERGVFRQKTSGRQTLNSVAGVLFKLDRCGMVRIELVDSSPDSRPPATKRIEYPNDRDCAEYNDNQRTHYLPHLAVSLFWFAKLQTIYMLQHTNDSLH